MAELTRRRILTSISTVGLGARIDPEFLGGEGA